jgi:hypothetical protein
LLHCYPQPGKGKALDVCRAFAAGCGGRVLEQTPAALLPGAAAFYGVRPQWAHLWSQAKAEGREWFYIDNGFIGAGRFRIARNAVQAAQCRPDPARLAGLGVTIAPWRRGGRHVLVCLQSDEFMGTVAGFTGDIAAAVCDQTDRPVRVRRKGNPRPLAADLADCWCVVTWASNAAVEAILAGVPAIVLGESAAAPMAGDGLDQIDAPPTPDGREEWAAGLAASQWTLEEIASGKAWAELHG